MRLAAVVLTAALLVPAATCQGGRKRMGTSVATFRPSAQIAAELRAQRGQIPGLPLEAAQGYPVPILHNGVLCLVIPFYRRTGKPPGPPDVYPLQWFAVLDPRSGARLEVKTLKEGVNQPAGKFVVEAKLTMAEFEKRQQAFYVQLDSLLQYASAPPAKPSDDVRARAAELRHLWREISPSALDPFYRRINPKWFEFIGL